MVPCAGMIINTLLPIGDKALEIPGSRRIAGFTDDDDKRDLFEWHKCLAAERMMFYMIQLTRHVVLVTFHQANDHSRLFTRCLDFSERMKSLGHTIIDEKILPEHFIDLSAISNLVLEIARVG